MAWRLQGCKGGGRQKGLGGPVPCEPASLLWDPCSRQLGLGDKPLGAPALPSFTSWIPGRLPGRQWTSPKWVCPSCSPGQPSGTGAGQGLRTACLQSLWERLASWSWEWAGGQAGPKASKDSGDWSCRAQPPREAGPFGETDGGCGRTQDPAHTHPFAPSRSESLWPFSSRGGVAKAGLAVRHL